MYSENTGPGRVEPLPPTYSVLKCDRPGGGSGTLRFMAMFLPPFSVPYSSQKSPPSCSTATTFAGFFRASQFCDFSSKLVMAPVQRLNVTRECSFSMHAVSSLAAFAARHAVAELSRVGDGS